MRQLNEVHSLCHSLIAVPYKHHFVGHYYFLARISVEGNFDDSVPRRSTDEYYVFRLHGDYEVPALGRLDTLGWLAFEDVFPFGGELYGRVLFYYQVEVQ